MPAIASEQVSLMSGQKRTQKNPLTLHHIDQAPDVASLGVDILSALTDLHLAATLGLQKGLEDARHEE